jgi:hypothetical protein
VDRPTRLYVGGCFIRLLCTSSGYLTNPLPEGDKPVDSGLVRDYEDIFIKVKNWGAFEGSDIERNGLHKYRDGTVPDFVTEFERELDGKPCLASDVCCFLDCSFDADGSM